MPNYTSLRTSSISVSCRGFRQSLDHKRGSASINEGNRHPQTVGCDRGNRCAAIHGHEGRCIVSDDDGKTGHYAGPPLLDGSSCCCRSSERFCTAMVRLIALSFWAEAGSYESKSFLRQAMTVVRLEEG